jgi:hypothetical protein
VDVTVGETANTFAFPVILSTDVWTAHCGLSGGATTEANALDDVELDGAEFVVEDGARTAAYTAHTRKNPTAHVIIEVFFGGLAPHFGQLFADVLTCSPHSLHLTNAMSFDLYIPENSCDCAQGVLAMEGTSPQS